MNRLVALLTLCGLAVGVGFVKAEEIRVEVDEKTCQKVQRHLARQDVNYKPGVDVRGKKVVPADIQSNQIVLPETISIDLSLPLQDLFDVANPPARELQNAEVEVGRIDYDISSGQLSFNGQKLAEPALVKIGEKCYEVYSD